MAVSHQGVFVQTPKIAQAFATHGNSTTPVVLYTSSTSGNGTKVVAVMAATTLASNRIVQVFRGTAGLLGSQTVLASAGNDGVTPTANLIGLIPLPKDNDGQTYFFLAPADTLQIAPTVAVTTNKKIEYTAVLADF